ncbi:MAG: glycosyltransferase family 4 protein [Firmicutes bacterium HGW-Firmicutes-2]|jgi:glycosyltransferase involved in cell wall biosynthesis|nr:MAG: glycosyltransferase family 4 protein [Firmicutes bacterium HGW-Firmicutes-2]
MRILFVVPGMGYGGAERVISILSNAFVTKGDSVKIINFDKEGITAYHLNAKVDLYKLGNMNTKSLKSIVSFINNLRSMIKAYNPDVIISFINDVCAITALANIGLKYPLIYSERNDPRFINNSLKEKSYGFLVKSLTDGFVFQTNGAKNLYSKKVRNRSAVILNPIQMDAFPKCWQGEREKLIVSVGRLHPQKNQKLLIKAFSNIADAYPDYIMKIYGEGPLKQELINQIHELELSERIFLEGNVENILERIVSAEIFAYSSNYEGLPNALMEAMVLGIPCISTDCSPGGAAMLIENEKNGLLVPIEDELALTNGLDYLLKNKEAASRMGACAINLVNEVNEEHIVREWQSFIQRIMDKKRNKN